jgi:hypothetical protein
MSRKLLAVVALALLVVVGSLSAPAAGASSGRHARQQEQRRLDGLHCTAGRPDGRLDAQFRDAVRRFQSRVGQPQSGRLVAATRQALRDKHAPRCDLRPVPAHSGSGRRIVVSQRQNWVWLVRHDGSVAAQAPDVDNPRVLHPGSYATGSYCGRSARIKRNTDLHGKYWLDDFVRFAPCGIGFHRVPRWKSTGRQIHPDWVLGTNQATSDGCIRLSRGMAERVWSFTSGGRTEVRVV